MSASGSSEARVCIVATGHLTTCPRMLRAADTLQAEGYRVRVVSVLSTPWAVQLDRELAAGRAWEWSPVELRRSRLRSRWASVRRRAMRRLVSAVGVERSGVAALAGALTRGAPELVQSASSAQSDLVYAGTVGGMGVGALAARRLGAALALDLEDFYAGDTPETPEGVLDRCLIERLEQLVLPGARTLTGGSEEIAAAYASARGVPVIPIHNVLPRPLQEPPPLPPAGARRRLFWFSQTVGSGRGIEDAVGALGRLGCPAVLSLLGNPAPGYLQSLAGVVQRIAPRVELRHLPPTSPIRLTEEARSHHIGLALEPRSPLNKDLALSNKALTYLTAGLGVVLSDTRGQQALASDIGPAAILYPAGDVATLAERLRPWLEDDAALERARRAAYEGALRRWHWEHPSERGAFLSGVEHALGRRSQV